MNSMVCFVRCGWYRVCFVLIIVLKVFDYLTQFYMDSSKTLSCNFDYEKSKIYSFCVFKFTFSNCLMNLWLLHFQTHLHFPAMNLFSDGISHLWTLGHYYFIWSHVLEGQASLICEGQCSSDLVSASKDSMAGFEGVVELCVAINIKDKG